MEAPDAKRIVTMLGCIPPANREEVLEDLLGLHSLKSRRGAIREAPEVQAALTSKERSNIKHREKEYPLRALVHGEPGKFWAFETGVEGGQILVLLFDDKIFNDKSYTAVCVRGTWDYFIFKTREDYLARFGEEEPAPSHMFAALVVLVVFAAIGGLVWLYVSNIPDPQPCCGVIPADMLSPDLDMMVIPQDMTPDMPADMPDLKCEEKYALAKKLYLNKQLTEAWTANIEAQKCVDEFGDDALHKQIDWLEGRIRDAALASIDAKLKTIDPRDVSKAVDNWRRVPDLDVLIDTYNKILKLEQMVEKRKSLDELKNDLSTRYPLIESISSCTTIYADSAGQNAHVEECFKTIVEANDAVTRVKDYESKCFQGSLPHCLSAGFIYHIDKEVGDRHRARSFFHLACSGGSDMGCFYVGYAVAYKHTEVVDLYVAHRLFGRLCSKYGGKFFRACSDQKGAKKNIEEQGLERCDHPMTIEIKNSGNGVTYCGDGAPYSFDIKKLERPRGGWSGDLLQTVNVHAKECLRGEAANGPLKSVRILEIESSPACDQIPFLQVTKSPDPNGIDFRLAGYLYQSGVPEKFRCKVIRVELRSSPA